MCCIFLGTKDFINRLKRFQGSSEPPCESGQYVHSVCIFGIEDLPYVTNETRKQLFLNKLNWNFQPWALDCLEWWHANRTAYEYNQFWMNDRRGLDLDIPFYEQYARQFGPRSWLRISCIRTILINKKCSISLFMVFISFWCT